MQGDIVAQGMELMLYGMGTVALFLALLVVTTTAMSRVINRFFPEPAAAHPAPAARRPAGQAGVDPETVAVISAAIHQHRSRRK